MNSDKLRKVTAAAITLLMFATVLAAILPNDPAVVSAIESEDTNDIMIFVLDSEFQDPLETASVILTEVHTGNTVNAYFDPEGYYVADGPPSGTYRIDVNADGFYSHSNVNGFNFTGLSDYSHPEIILTEFDDFVYTYTVNVKDQSNTSISGATVKFYDSNVQPGQVITSNTTNISGATTLKIFGGSPLDLIVTARGYNMSVISLPAITGPATVDIKINTSIKVRGWAKTEAGSVIQETSSAYLYNTDTNLPWVKRVLKSTGTGSYVKFEAYPGDWILVVDAPSYDPMIGYINLTTETEYPLDIKLKTQTESIEETKIVFIDWNHLIIYDNETWNEDYAYPGLYYSDIGSLRAQIDLVTTNLATRGNGIVEAVEYEEFLEYLQLIHGPNYVSTNELLTVNNSRFLRTAVDNVWVDNATLEGDVVDKSNVSYSSKASYTAHTLIDANAPDYRLNMSVPVDSSEIERLFLLDLITDYEMSSNTTSPSGLVDVTGYLVVYIDPKTSIFYNSVSISMTVEQSEDPIAKASIHDDSIKAEIAYKKTNTTYVVKMGENITFTSFGSKDTNGLSITVNYTWDFGDGTPLNTTTTYQIEHNYISAADNLTVSLNVTDISGRSNVTTFYVEVDGLPPRVEITVAGNYTAETVLEQGDPLELSPEACEDDLVSVGDEGGAIRYYEWTIDNETLPIVMAENETLNITYNFNVAGEIEVVLNVTDMVGNYANASMTISVNDTTSPTPRIEPLKNITGGTSLKENSPIIFDAQNTTDNVDDLGNLTFEWTFGDDSNTIVGLNYSYMNHTYESFGSYTLKLNVTDRANNTGTYTTTVTVGTGPRPVITPTKITFDPAVFEEGKSGRITVNITNEGSATAMNITVDIKHYQLDVEQELIGTITTFYTEGGIQITSLAPGESAYGVLTWEPSTKGNYTLRAIGDSDDQPTPKWKSSYVVVEEAGWKRIALYGGILAIFIIIPLLLILRRRIASGAGMRRSRMREREGKK